MRARPKISLKMQAIGFLSRREHSRQELRLKLLAAWRKSERERVARVLGGVDADGDVDADGSRDRVDPEAIVDELLDWLTAQHYLSDARFVESRVHARAGKHGVTMIRHELSRHGLILAPEQAAALRETEFARAQALWQRKFGEVAVDAGVRARQARFLIARGFASDVVRRVIGGSTCGSIDD